ncbi:MAG: hypothetical protein FWD29_04535 [Micrococcales bacterium]|nr:hypothetical protein [Micrococcales bacterium]
MKKRRIAASLGALAIGLAGTAVVGSATHAAGPIGTFTAAWSAGNVVLGEEFNVLGQCTANDPALDPVQFVQIEVSNLNYPWDQWKEVVTTDAGGFWVSSSLSSPGEASWDGWAFCYTYNGYVEGISLPSVDVVEVWATVNGYNPATVAAGSSVTVQGGGFLPGETVDATLNSQPVFLGSGPAPNPKMTVTIPASTPLGAHTIVLQGANSGRTASVKVNVIAGGRLPVIETGIGL